MRISRLAVMASFAVALVALFAPSVPPYRVPVVYLGANAKRPRRGNYEARLKARFSK